MTETEDQPDPGKAPAEQRSQGTSTDAPSKVRSKSSQSKQPRASAKKTAPSVKPSNGAAASNLSSSILAPRKDDDQQSNKHSVNVETTHARSNLEVVRLCLRELRWKEVRAPAGAIHDPEIHWHASSFHDGHINISTNTGRVNKFPGMNDLLRKVHLTRLLNNMRLLFPHEYDFYPKTWFLPEQAQQFKDDVRYIHDVDAKQKRRPTTFIVKPSDGSQGEGIYLIRDPSQMIATKRAHVIQEYIDRPLLLGGLKFDLRIYVLILNLHPLEIYLYDEGLARFATVDYKAPTGDNLHETYMHLTNYSLNRRSVTYKHTVSEQQTDGSKRKLSLVWKQLTEIFGSEKIMRTKSSITELINRTILAVVSELRVEYEFHLPRKRNPTVSCFQIIGFDIILDHQLKPIILEVNANPSLRLGFDKENEEGRMVCQPSLVDEEIKKPLVLETLKLALPKKRLDALARHTQNQVNDKIIAERVEKLAQQRLAERNEKAKNARRNRFDLRFNPLFSRPAPSRPKETTSDDPATSPRSKPAADAPASVPFAFTTEIQPPDAITPYALFNTDRVAPNRLIKRPKKTRYVPRPDDDESGSVTNTVIETVSSLTLKRPSVTSGSLVSTVTRTDIASTMTPSGSLKAIFSAENQKDYEHLLIIDRVADIFVQVVVLAGSKTMTGAQFRNFANVCGIVDESITSSSIDILYHQIVKKWQQFVSRVTLAGLPFAAFIEAFFFLSQRKFPTARNLLDSANCLIDACIDRLHATPQVSPFTAHYDQHALRQSARFTHTFASPSANRRSNGSFSRSLTTTSMRRGVLTSISPDANTSYTSANLVEDKPRQKTLQPVAKSVFPLFFDVV